MKDIREDTKKISNITHASFPIRKFVAPEIILGDSSRNLINQYVLSLAGQNIFLVTDPGVIKAGWAGEITDNLTSAGLDVVVYDKVSPNPRSEEVMQGRSIMWRTTVTW